MQREIPHIEKLYREKLPEEKPESHVSILHVSKCFSFDFELGKDKRHLVHMLTAALIFLFEMF